MTEEASPEVVLPHRQTEPSPYVLESIKPQDFFERYIVTTAETVNSLGEKDVREIRRLAASVSNFANQSDVVITTGRSREIPSALLRSSGISEEKLIEFDHEANSNVYKDEDPPYSSYTEADRIALLIDDLQRQGVTLHNENPISICIVDDRIRSGGKAKAYLDLLSKIDGVRSCSFAAFVSQFALPTDEADPRVYVPPPPPDNRQAQRTYTVLNSLTALSAVTSIEYVDPEEELSPTLKPIIKAIKNTAMKILTTPVSKESSPVS